jgi:hypothetical protein
MFTLLFNHTSSSCLYKNSAFAVVSHRNGLHEKTWTN